MHNIMDAVISIFDSIILNNEYVFEMDDVFKRISMNNIADETHKKHEPNVFISALNVSS